MKKTNLLLSLLVFCFFTGFAQQGQRSALFDLVEQNRATGKEFPILSVFTRGAQIPSVPADPTVSVKTLLRLDIAAMQQLYDTPYPGLSLVIPARDGSEFVLEMIRQDINTAGDFSFGSLRDNGVPKKITSEQGVHYRGYISGNPGSMACISIFANGHVMGIFSDGNGNYNIGKTSPNGNEYILYNSNDLKAPLSFNCGTSESLPAELRTVEPTEVPVPSVLPPPLLCKKVRVYWEGDYKLFANDFNSNIDDTRNYLAGLFNQVATMYQNEGILIELTDSYVWVTPDPYTTSSSSAALSTFKGRWNSLGNSFRADLAVLIDGAPTNNGGIAYLLTNNLCSRNFAYGYANVYGSYNNVPVYSWDVEVVTHEMGHMMGSHHTHWCGWNTGAGGSCGAIDDCYTTETGSSCSTCAATTTTNPSPPPGFKGTVMSYCHLRPGIGISLANGFGPLPQAAIRNTVNIAACAIRDNKWTGTVSTAWEDPANWGCGSIPDASTDVSISSGLIRYPVVNSAAVCRRLIQEPNTSVLVKTGFTLLLAGPPSAP